MKKIPGFSGYRATEDGRIFNARGRQLKTYQGSKGYEFIKIKADSGNRITSGVHRLVAAAHLGAIPKGYWVNHKDGNKLNNHVSNLEITTPGDNLKHSFRELGRVGTSYNPDKRELVRIMLQQGWSQHKLAKALEISQCRVSHLANE